MVFNTRKPHRYVSSSKSHHQLLLYAERETRSAHRTVLLNSAATRNVYLTLVLIFFLNTADVIYFSVTIPVSF